MARGSNRRPVCNRAPNRIPPYFPKLRPKPHFQGRKAILSGAAAHECFENHSATAPKTNIGFAKAKPPCPPSTASKPGSAQPGSSHPPSFLFPRPKATTDFWGPETGRGLGRPGIRKTPQNGANRPKCRRPWTAKPQSRRRPTPTRIHLHSQQAPVAPNQLSASFAFNACKRIAFSRKQEIPTKIVRRFALERNPTGVCGARRSYACPKEKKKMPAPLQAARRRLAPPCPVFFGMKIVGANRAKSRLKPSARIRFPGRSRTTPNNSLKRAPNPIPRDKDVSGCQKSTKTQGA